MPWPVIARWISGSMAVALIVSGKALFRAAPNGHARSLPVLGEH